MRIFQPGAGYRSRSAVAADSFVALLFLMILFMMAFAATAFAATRPAALNSRLSTELPPMFRDDTHSLYALARLAAPKIAHDAQRFDL